MRDVILLIALIVAPRPDYACTVVDAGPQAIEVFCIQPRTNKLRFALIERDGIVRSVEGRSL